MARREDIETSVWSDPEFLALTGPARAVYLWSFTNHRCGMAGIYKVGKPAIEMETGFAGEELAGALVQLQEHRFLFYDGRILFVRTRVRHLRSRSRTIAVSIRTDLAHFADHPFIELWWQENGQQGWIAAEMEKPIGTGFSDGSCMGPLRDPQGTGTGKGMGSGEGGVGGSVAAPVAKPVVADLPTGFPDELRPHLDRVEIVLGELAARHRAQLVRRRALADVLMANQRKRLVAAAYACSSHWTGGGRRLSDVLRAYRNWLAREPDFAAVESVGADGLPAAGVSSPPPNAGAAVTSMRPRDQRRAERLAALDSLLAQGGAA